MGMEWGPEKSSLGSPRVCDTVILGQLSDLWSLFLLFCKTDTMIVTMCNSCED